MISRLAAFLVLLALSCILLPSKAKAFSPKPKIGYEIKSPSAPVQPTSERTFVKASDITHAPVIEVTSDALGLLIGVVKCPSVHSEQPSARHNPLLVGRQILFRTLISPNAP
ncbi:MAG TPA: hypothetical protein VFE50_23765 [Cyclobacteriaceae bacterium]|nr:hypothetical protein [Cyclobacteriaceae bacterium]